jgi:hypothetical protein
VPLYTFGEVKGLLHLRLGVLSLAVALPVRAYTALFHAAAPDWDAVMGVEAARALGGLGALLVVAVAMALRHRKKMPWRAILAAAFEQPGWWSGWYPRRFRRPGDVWHGLPRRIRRFNNAVGLTAALIVFVSVPLAIVLVASQGFAARTGRPSALGAWMESLSAGRSGGGLRRARLQAAGAPGSEFETVMRPASVPRAR